MPGGTSAHDYVAVHDEPDHAHCLDNEYAYVYRVRLAPGGHTLWHRHCEDTLYFSLADARARQEFPHDDAIVTELPCGEAVSRPHREHPLIHKVTNLSERPFHMIGAEALRVPEVGRERPLPHAGHHLLLETPRLRAYRIALPEAGVRYTYDCHGLLIALTPCALSCSTGTPREQLAFGELRWLSAPTDVTFATAFDGLFAEWRH